MLNNQHTMVYRGQQVRTTFIYAIERTCWTLHPLKERRVLGIIWISCNYLLIDIVKLAAVTALVIGISSL